MIRGGRILLSATSDWTNNQNGQWMLTAAANILVRMAPVITRVDIAIPFGAQTAVRVPLLEGDEFSGSLLAMCHRIVGVAGETEIDIVGHSNPKDYDAVLALGGTPSTNQVTIASTGWRAILGSSASRFSPEETKLSPLGSQIAAYLGVAELFKTILKLRSPGAFADRVVLSSDITFSAFDYSAEGMDPGPDLPQRVQLDSVAIVGIGAIGASTLYSLGSIPAIQGAIQLVDPDIISFSNLNRHLLACRNDAVNATSKVKLASDLLPLLQPGIEPIPWVNTYDVYRQSTCQLPDIALSVVDNVDARRAIQRDLPRLILDAGTIDSSYALLRVDLGRGGACLGCKHPYRNDPFAYEQSIAAATGLALDEVLGILRGSGLIEESHLPSLSNRTGRSVSDLLTLIGVPLVDLVQQEICSTRTDIEGSPSIAFLSAIPGVLLAAELIKERYFPYAVLDNRFSHDVFRRPNPQRYYYRLQKHPYCSCGCSTPEFIQRYLTKH